MPAHLTPIFRRLDMSGSTAQLPDRTVCCTLRIEVGNNSQTYTVRKLKDPNDRSVVRRFNLTRLHRESCAAEMVYTCTLFDDGGLHCSCPGHGKAFGYCKHVGALLALGMLDNDDLLLARKAQLDADGERIRLEDEVRKIQAERTELVGIRADLRAAIEALKTKPRNRFTWTPSDLEPAA
jgi:hypothetical protein